MRPSRRRDPRLFVAALALALAVLLFRAFRSAPPPHGAARPQPPERKEPTALPPSEWAHARHLVMVAGHAVYTGASRTAADVVREDSWHLESFQHGQLDTMLGHIRRGIEIASADNGSLLVFSGGETRAAAGPRSEAGSYWEAANALGWYGHGAVRARALLEVNARDSMENLLFSVCRFRQATGAYPDRITVVSFGFKQRRFAELHRAALRFPQSRFHFVGLDPPHLARGVLAAELSHSSKPFETDPYGCGAPELTAKRAARNPFRRGRPAAGYDDSCPEMSGLLEHCAAAYFGGALPWSDRLGDDLDVRGLAGRKPKLDARVAGSRFARAE